MNPRLLATACALGALAIVALPVSAEPDPPQHESTDDSPETK